MVMSYDVMTFAHDSYYESWVSRTRLIERVIGFMRLDRWKRMCAVDSYESADGFRTMTHYES